eukprot:750903-Hanusia_phi.AAC.5
MAQYLMSTEGWGGPGGGAVDRGSMCSWKGRNGGVLAPNGGVQRRQELQRGRVVYERATCVRGSLLDRLPGMISIQNDELTCIGKPDE